MRTGTGFQCLFSFTLVIMEAGAGIFYCKRLFYANNLEAGVSILKYENRPCVSSEPQSYSSALSSYDGTYPLGPTLAEMMLDFTLRKMRRIKLG